MVRRLYSVIYVITVSSLYRGLPFGRSTGGFREKVDFEKKLTFSQGKDFLIFLSFTQFL